MDQNAMYFFCIAGGLLIAEIISPATIFIFPSIVAMLVGILAMFVNDIWVLGGIFFVGSALMIALVRPMFVTSKNDVGYKQGSESLIGKRVKVIETIDPDLSQGRIKHAGNVFPARAEKIIKEGSWVTIEAVEGITVYVIPPYIEESVVEDIEEIEK